MGSPEDSQKRSEHARRQKRGAFRRFPSAAEPVPEASARWEKKRSPAVRAPKASARQQKRSAIVLEPQASAHQEKHSTALRAPVLSTAAVERSMRASECQENKLRSGYDSGVVSEQKKTIDLMTSSSDKSTQLRPVEQLKGKEKKVSKNSLMDSWRPGFVMLFMFLLS
jgi:hypothetical protein